MTVLETKEQFKRYYTECAKILSECNHKIKIFDIILNSLTNMRGCQMCKSFFRKEYKFIHDLERLVRTLPTEFHCSIEFKSFAPDSVAYFPNDSNTLYEVTINTDQTVEEQLYCFLHELGHAKINRDQRQCMQEKAILFARKNGREFKLSKTKYEDLSEEIYAWEIALFLASFYEVSIDYNNFQRIREESLKTYL